MKISFVDSHYAFNKDMNKIKAFHKMILQDADDFYGIRKDALKEGDDKLIQDTFGIVLPA